MTRNSMNGAKGKLLVSMYIYEFTILGSISNFFGSVAQSKAAKDRMEDYLHEANKPLARYKDDKDLDDMLKKQDREDDPMLAYMQKKKAVGNKKAGIKGKS